MKDLEKNSLQFDYFSINYKNFEENFYKFSNISVPLIFLTDDLLLHMVSTGHSYFLLNSKNSADDRDHYFIFKKFTSSENNFISQFEYLGQISPISFEDKFYVRKWVFSLGWFFILSSFYLTFYFKFFLSSFFLTFYFQLLKFLYLSFTLLIWFFFLNF